MIFGGDFNIDICKDDSESNNLIGCMNGLGLKNLFKSPTRTTRTSATGLDNIFSSLQLIPTDLKIITSDLSDHSPLLATFNLENQTNRKVEDCGEINNGKRVNWNKINDFLLGNNAIDWGSVFNSQDPNEALSNFVNVLHSLFFTPKRIHTTSTRSRNTIHTSANTILKPWLNFRTS